MSRSKIVVQRSALRRDSRERRVACACVLRRAKEAFYLKTSGILSLRTKEGEKEQPQPAAAKPGNSSSPPQIPRSLIRVSLFEALSYSASVALMAQPHAVMSIAGQEVTLLNFSCSEMHIGIWQIYFSCPWLACELTCLCCVILLVCQASFHSKKFCTTRINIDLIWSFRSA